MESTRSGLQRPGAQPSGGRLAVRAVLFAQLGTETDPALASFGALREIVVAHEGTIVRQGALSLCASFPSAHGAMATGMSAQASREQFDAGVGWRIGIDASRPAASLRGDPTLVPLIGAKHLAEQASEGEVLASERVWDLLSPRGARVFHRARRTEVSGMPDRPLAWGVSWEAPGDSSSRLPAALSPHLEGPFIGRASEGAWLRAAWRRAKGGRAELVSISGPSGIGKTSLCAQLGKVVVEEGGVVLYGARDESSGAPYQVFVEALLQLTEQEFVVSLGASQRAELARLSPGLAEDPTAAGVSADPDSGRIRLFDAVRAFVAGAAECHPVLVVLDDLQWIDRAEALLLDHLARNLGGARVLLVAVHRSGLGDDHRYRLVSPTARLRLPGFGPAEVARYLTEVLPDRDWKRSGFAEALWHETFGNPLFVSMAAGELAESGAAATSFPLDSEIREPSELGPASPLGPGGASALVGRRLGRLGEDVRRALEQAAALGRQFDSSLLGRAMGEADEELVARWLEVACRGGLLRSVRGTYSFTHAFIRQVLLDGLEALPHAELHLRAAEALEAGTPEGTELSAIAICYRIAGSVAPPGKAIDWSVRAGEAAVASLAWEEARGHWEAALDLMEKSGSGATQRALLRRHLA
ncbi:MAG: ATP-binding protein, partial [Acidimicrobiia bacterium]